MAKNNDVDINIKTKADAKGLRMANKELARLTKEKNKAEKEAYQHAKALEKEEKALQRTSKATERVAKGTKKAGKAGTRAGNSILYASQAFEDLQYGIRGVLNNIPQLVMSLGGSMGLAGVISIVAVVASKLGGAFNTAKTATKSLSDAIGNFNTDKLDEIKASKKDLEIQDNYTKAIDAETEALKNNTASVKSNAEAKKLERKLELDQAKVQAKLDTLKVEQGAGTSADKQTKLAAIREKMAILTNQDEESTIRENIEALESARSGAISQAGSQSVAAAELEKTIPTASSILGARGKSVSAGKLFARSVESLKGGKMSGLALKSRKTLKKTLSDAFGGVSAIADAQYKRQSSAIEFMNSKISDLESAVLSGNDEFQKTALESIVNIAESNEARRVSDNATIAGVKGSQPSKINDIDRDLNKRAALAKKALRSIGREVTLESEADDMATERAKKQSDVERLREGATTSAQSAGELTKRIDAEKKILASVKARRATEKQIRDLQNQAAAKSAAAEDRKSLDEENKNKTALAESAADLGILANRSGRSLAASFEDLGRSGVVAPSLKGKSKRSVASLRDDGATSSEVEGSLTVLRDVREALRGTGKASQTQLKLVNDLIGVAQSTSDQLRAAERQLKKQQDAINSLKSNAKRQEK